MSAEQDSPKANWVNVKVHMNMRPAQNWSAHNVQCFFFLSLNWDYIKLCIAIPAMTSRALLHTYWTYNRQIMAKHRIIDIWHNIVGLCKIRKLNSADTSITAMIFNMSAY